MAQRTAHHGFTLLELLIVIAIIGILVTIAAVSYTSVQKKTRDTRRINDMKSIQNAFEQYYADNNNTYSCTPGTAYLPVGFPTEPKGTSYTQYTGSCAGTSYVYCAKVENPVGNATSGAGAGMGSVTAGTYYCVTNLQ